jgi:hypothetical protein
MHKDVSISCGDKGYDMENEGKGKLGITAIII